MSRQVDYAPLFRLDQAAIADPHDYFEALRRSSPVEFIEELGCYAVTRYDDVLEVVRDPARFSSVTPTGPKQAGEMFGVFQQVAAEVPEALDWLSEASFVFTTRALLNADPPDHDRQRALVNRAFTPRRVQTMEAEIRAVSNRLIDGFVDRGEVEFVREYAVPLPLTVIATALGVDDGDFGDFKRWSDDFTVLIGNHHAGRDEVAGMLRAMAEFARYFRASIDARRVDPHDDLISDVVSARVDGVEPLTVDEMLVMFSQFLVAGNETTTKLLASAILMLLRAPTVLDQLRADPTRIPMLVEEALRMEAPVQGLFRTATRDTEIGGVPVPAGSSLWVVYASANRDDGEFADPNHLRFDRDNAKAHLSFGNGAHFCLGAALARAESRIAFETLLDRLDDIALVPGRSLDYEPSYVLHGLKELHLTFKPRA